MGTIPFERDMREVLLSPWTWRFVSSLFRPDCAPLDSRRYVARIAASRTHKHLHRQVILALRGHAAYVLREEVYPWNPGVVFLHNAGESHDSGQGLTGDSLAYLEVYLLDEILIANLTAIRNGEVIKLTSGKGLVLSAVESGIAIGSHWSELAARHDIPREVARALLQSSVQFLVSRLLDPGALIRAQQLALRPDARSKVLETICSHIRDTGGRDVTLENMASLTGYSTDRFRHLFREYAGTSFRDYVDSCRAQKADELLAEGLTHRRVAEELGFADASGFSRWRRLRRQRG